MAPLSLYAGLRYSDVRFKSDDHYITAANPDDSGRVSYSHLSPVAGAVWHATDAINVYANAGEGFETPTFIELAYRNVGSGLNFDLKPAISRSVEAGIKAQLGAGQRVNLAVFGTRTSNEIVIDTATGGRTTYKNASKTRRSGIEAQWDGDLGGGFVAYAAYTYLSRNLRERYDERHSPGHDRRRRQAPGRSRVERIRRTRLVARRMAGILCSG